MRTILDDCDLALDSDGVFEIEVNSINTSSPSNLFYDGDSLFFKPKNKTGLRPANNLRNSQIDASGTEETAKFIRRHVPEGIEPVEYLKPILDFGSGKEIITNITLPIYISAHSSKIDLRNVDFKNLKCEGPRDISLDISNRVRLVEAGDTHVDFELPDCYRDNRDKRKISIPKILKDIDWSKIDINDINYNSALVPFVLKNIKIRKHIKQNMSITRKSDIEKVYGGDGVDLSSNATRSIFKYTLDYAIYYDQLEIVTEFKPTTAGRYIESFLRLRKNVSEDSLEQRIYDAVKGGTDIALSNWFGNLVRAFIISGGNFFHDKRLFESCDAGFSSQMFADGIVKYSKSNSDKELRWMPYIDYACGPDSSSTCSPLKLANAIREDAINIRSLADSLDKMADFCKACFEGNVDEEMKMSKFFCTVMSKAISLNPFALSAICEEFKAKDSKFEIAEFMEKLEEISKELVM